VERVTFNFRYPENGAIRFSQNLCTRPDGVIQEKCDFNLYAIFEVLFYGLWRRVDWWKFKVFYNLLPQFVCEERETVRLSDASVNSYQSKRCHVPEGGKRQSNPFTGLDRPWGFQEFEAPRFQDNRHMKVVILSALRTGRLYPPRKYSWYAFLLESESTPGP